MVDHELVRVETQSALGFIRPVDTKTVELARQHVTKIAVPDIFRAFWQRNALKLSPSMTREQAEFDLLGVGRKQGEIRTASVPGSSQGMWRTGGQSCVNERGREKLQQVVE